MSGKSVKGKWHSKSRPKSRCDSASYWSSEHGGCCRSKPYHEDECENTVHICTHVNINQSNQADANGGSGGSGGSASSSAASAVSTGEGDSSASAASRAESETETSTNQTAEQAAADAPDLEAAAADDVSALEDVGDVGTSASAVGGAGGGGGSGGSITQSNSASVTVDNLNVVVITCGENYPGTAVNLGSVSRSLDIKVDEKGDTFINGQKMEEQELANGTKVFVFRNTESSGTQPVVE